MAEDDAEHLAYYNISYVWIILNLCVLFVLTRLHRRVVVFVFYICQCRNVQDVKVRLDARHMSVIRGRVCVPDAESCSLTSA